MACRAVQFALTEAQVLQLLFAVGRDKEMRRIVQEEIEAAWDTAHLVEMDKSWDAMHRCLTEGKLGPDDGEFPLNQCVLGGAYLYEGADFIFSLKSQTEVKAITAALDAVTEEWFKARYAAIEGYAPEWGEDDYGYTWAYFMQVRDFYRQAAQEGRAVLFSVDQ